MGKMSIMDRTGHTELRWDPRNPAEVEAARTAFDALKKKGFVAFAVKWGRPAGEIKEFVPDQKRALMMPSARLMRSFEIEVEEIVVQPAIAGG